MLGMEISIRHICIPQQVGMQLMFPNREISKCIHRGS